MLDLAANSEQLLTPHVGVALSNQAEFVDNDTLLISTNIEREYVALAHVEIAADGTPGAVDYIAASGEGVTPMVLSFHGGPEGQSRPSFRSRLPPCVRISI